MVISVQGLTYKWQMVGGLFVSKALVTKSRCTRQLYNLRTATHMQASLWLLDQLCHIPAWFLRHTQHTIHR